jgi:hypothetical protein
MVMGKKRARQQDFWIATGALPRSRGHIFYDRVNEILKGEDFDGGNALVFTRARR